MKFALLQLSVGTDAATNISKALDAIKQVKTKNPDLKVAILPECFTGPYGTQFFKSYAEKIPDGLTCQSLSKLAKTLAIFIIGGSFIEEDSGKFYNTCTVWSPDGNLIGKHRKVHLFDINIKAEIGGGIHFTESSVLTPGNSFTVVEIEKRRIGIGICHDMRFDELAKIYRKENCDMIVYPSAFCVVQGPIHWELLHKSRANDNQLFVITVSSARDVNAGYVAYGHSMVVDPWGKVVQEATEKQETLVVDIDFSIVDDVRKQIPIFTQRRTDMYDTIKKV